MANILPLPILRQQNIFDADESALFYNAQSNITLELKKNYKLTATVLKYGGK